MWVGKQLPSKVRPSTILVLASNVLEPDVVKATFSLLQDIKDIKDGRGSPLWEQKCARSPFKKCMELSVFEAFRLAPNDTYDELKISKLSSLAEVTNAISSTAESNRVNGMAFNPKDYLGSVKYDSSENIFGAGAMLVNLLGVNDEDGQDYEDYGDYEGENDSILDFEEKLVKLVNDRQFPQGMVVYPFTMRSFDDVMDQSLKTDVKTMAAGYMLIYIYVLLNLGKLNMVEQRMWLAVTGILAVMMGVITSFGLAAYLGVFYSQMNQLLPFLMLGIGVDDMFVIMQAFDNLDKEEREQELGRRFGQTMRHAGVAITITSLTDLLAFAIGATTVLPALSSFCIYAALGIFFIYFYVITFFLAWFCYDQRRVEEDRDECLCCWRRKDWEPSKCSRRSLLKIVFEWLAKILLHLPSKIAILLLTLVILAGGIYGVIRIDTFFDYNSFIEEGSYLRNFLRFKELHFPEEGQASTIYFAGVDYVEDMDKILHLLNDLEELSAPHKNNIAPNSMKFWVKDFIKFVNRKRGAYYETSFNSSYTNASFSEDLLQFLSNPSEGGMYRQDFEFEREIDFSQPVPKILLSSMSYKHPIFDHSKDGTVAMNEVFEAIERQNFSGKVFATSQAYSSYITMEIITMELCRNMAMALIVVFVSTLILIANLATSVIVLITVTLTVVNVAGYAYFWGLSIDTLFAIFMTISIGLCVDYSAHIAHAFTVEEGSSNERMKKTLIKTGPAVLNGGISTFLSFVLLFASKSIIFLTFFKIFFLVVLFGLFHGLLFLPVVLSLVGSKSNDGQQLESKPAVKSAWHKTKTFDDTSLDETKSNPSFYSVNLQPFSLPGSLEDLGESRPEKLKRGSPKKLKKNHKKTGRLPPLL